MEPMTSDIESDDSAPPTGGHDASIATNIHHLWRFSEEAKQKIIASAIAVKYKELLPRDNHKRRPEWMHPGVLFNRYGIESGDWRKGRKDQIKSFRENYIYNDDMEKRVCTWTGDSCNLFGIIWVGVHGADSICVVTSKGVVGKERLTNFLTLMPEELLRFLLRKSIICEIEDLADLSSELREKIKKNIKKPFGIVSAKPGPDKESGLEDSSSEYDVTRATQFLKQKTCLATIFTADETIRTAIHAFQHLFWKKLEAADIEASVMDPKYLDPKYVDLKYVPTAAPRYEDATVKNLQDHVIQEHLDAFDESDPGKLEEHSAVAVDLGNPPKKPITYRG